MNTYLYAPKDDSKHRVYWRELYSVDESEALRALIESAHENNINFIYAISPGLDVTYSNEKEQQVLKRKLDQVKEFGCKYFAILFDDIDNEMQQSDKVKFKSFADAQSYLTNILYEHLDKPEQFYFCPTEYCDVFAKPNVDQSEYLKTIGEKLMTNIRIMWTGPGIVSEYITIKHIRKISQILKRKPLIWDNFHANDYDLSCIFLGPFTSRSPNLRKYISGMLTNPNCEFECNYVPIFTLALWSHSLSLNTNEEIDDEDEFGSSQSVMPPKSPPFVIDNDVEMMLLKDDEDVKIDADFLEYIDQYLNNRAINDKIDLRNFYYEPNKVMPLAIRKWLPTLDERQSEVVTTILVDQSSDLTASASKMEDDSSSIISALNSTTKQKAQQVACNSLVIKSSNETIIGQEQQGEVFVVNSGNDDIIVFCEGDHDRHYHHQLHHRQRQEATIASLSRIKEKKRIKKKLLKKFFINKFDDSFKKRKRGGGKRNRVRVDGGEFYKHRNISKKIISSKFKNRKTFFYGSIRKATARVTNSKTSLILTSEAPLPPPAPIFIPNNNDDDMDESQMDSTTLTRPCSSTFLSPVAQNMLVDEATSNNIDISVSSIDQAQPLIILDSTQQQQQASVDIELLSLPTMSLPPSTRASSIASSSSSSLLSNRNKRKMLSSSPKKRKKYEPFIHLSSSSKSCFKARKKLKKCVNNNNYNKIVCTSPMDLGMLSDATVTNYGGGGGGRGRDDMFNEWDLKILVDLYYLPFEYGKFSIYLLKEFQWLKLNVIRVNPNLNVIFQMIFLFFDQRICFLD